MIFIRFSFRLLFFKLQLYPICLPEYKEASKGGDYADEDEETLVGTFGRILGWGSTKQQNSTRVKRSTSKKLKEADVRIISNLECGRLMKGETSENYINKNHICALTSGVDACQGDSGGPLVTIEKGRWVQTGVVSTGHGCADARFPGVYTNVVRYLDWIIQETEGENVWSVNCNKF